MNILNKPLSQLSAAELRDGVAEKFGSVTRFVKLAGLTYFDVQKALKDGTTDYYQPHRERIYKLAKGLENEPIDGYEITDKTSEKIQEKIEDEYGNARQFCINNPRFGYMWTCRVMGKTKKKQRLITKKVKELLIVLQLDDEVAKIKHL